MFFSLLTFIFSTILLYLSSRALTNILFKIFSRLTKSQTTSINLIFFLFLPGIFLHEFSHILSATLLRVPTGRLSLKPELQVPNSQIGFRTSASTLASPTNVGPSSEPKKFGSLTLGSAQIASTDPIRLTLIGTAPFITGTTILWLILTLGLNLNLTQLSLNPILQTPPLILFLFGYLLFAISSTMFSSPSDLQAAGFPLFLLIFIFGIFKITNLQIPPALLTSITNFLSLLSLVFGLTLTLNILIFLPLKLLTKNMLNYS